MKKTTCVGKNVLKIDAFMVGNCSYYVQKGHGNGLNIENVFCCADPFQRLQ